MKNKLIITHMRAAFLYANLSHCERRKVGCVIVKNDSIIAIGYNGTPSGDDNCCELDSGSTKPTVIHAEDNALRKLTKGSESAKDAIAFVTTAPCSLCAPRLVDAGVKAVYYVDLYRCEEGIKYLESKGVTTTQLDADLFN